MTSRIVMGKLHYKSFDNEEIVRQNKGFRYINGSMKTQEQNKIGLTQIYAKGVVMNDHVHAFVYIP